MCEVNAYGRRRGAQFVWLGETAYASNISHGATAKCSFKYQHLLTLQGLFLHPSL